MNRIIKYLFFVLAIVGIIILLLPDHSKNTKTATSSDYEVNVANLANAKEFKVHIIDVGQGDAILIQSENDAVLVDAGNKGKGKEVLEYLQDEGVEKLTAVVSTHPDADHIGGLAEIIRKMEVEAVYAPKITHTTEAYRQFLLAVKERGLSIKVAKAGVEIPALTEGLTMDFLAPLKEYNKVDLNNWSAVLQINFGNNKFLLTGDAETAVENDLLKDHALQHVDVLKVSHHGASEATSSAFLDVIKPDFAAVSVGASNPYHHPTFDTADRLDKSGAKLYRTDEHGSIIFVSDGENIIVKVER